MESNLNDSSLIPVCLQIHFLYLFLVNKEHRLVYFQKNKHVLLHRWQYTVAKEERLY